ncbi:MAG: hypothetical protein JWL70_1092, partial [Acidimicrobiia bacterium]|nr:hypothetical protein [Acidimicrobiia bacterium]
VAFLSTGPLAGLCVEDSEGRLRAVPVWVHSASADVVTVRPVGGSSTLAGPACLVADEFASYVGIRGAIVRGELEPASNEAAVMRVTHASGFSFENTTTSL